MWAGGRNEADWIEYSAPSVGTGGGVFAYLSKALTSGLASGTVQLIDPHDCAQDGEWWYRGHRTKSSTGLPVVSTDSISRILEGLNVPCDLIVQQPIFTMNPKWNRRSCVNRTPPFHGPIER